MNGKISWNFERENLFFQGWSFHEKLKSFPDWDENAFYDVFKDLGIQ